LQGSESAQAALLNSAHQTIDKLAQDDDHDVQLGLELAQEYEKLARLELSRTPLTVDAIHQSAQDIEKESGILKQMNPADPEVARLIARLPELIQSSNAAAKQQAR